MTATTRPTGPAAAGRDAPAPPPRFGGFLWRLARATSPLTMPIAGKRWNPIFAVVEHLGRRSGRRYATPVAVRRTADGFVIALAFGAQVDWYRNLVSAGGGTIRWRGRPYRVTAPERLDVTSGVGPFHPVQRFFLRLGGVDRYIRVRDADTDS